MTALKVKWLAGYLEGEGSFNYHCYSQRIGFQTTDVDVAEKAARLLGGEVKGPIMRAKGRQPIYYVQVYGDKARKWMKVLKPHMGTRRREQITDALSRRGKAR